MPPTIGSFLLSQESVSSLSDSQSLSQDIGDAQFALCLLQIGDPIFQNYEYTVTAALHYAVRLISVRHMPSLISVRHISVRHIGAPSLCVGDA